MRIDPLQVSQVIYLFLSALRRLFRIPNPLPNKNLPKYNSDLFVKLCPLLVRPKLTVQSPIDQKVSVLGSDCCIEIHMILDPALFILWRSIFWVKGYFFREGLPAKHKKLY